jgi:hypothetical protein
METVHCIRLKTHNVSETKTVSFFRWKRGERCSAAVGILDNFVHSVA